MFVIDFFLRVSPVFWSALIAALVSIAGVVAANRSSMARLLVQHENDQKEAALQRSHDATQKAEDRKAAIRRQVYTDAVEQAHAVLGAIGSLPARPLDFGGVSDVEPLHAFLKANAKVWLVAESDAALLSRELTGQMAELYSKAIVSAHPLRVEFQKILDINVRLAHGEDETRRIDIKIAELKEANADFLTRQAAANSWKEAHDWIAELKNSRQHVFDSMMPARIEHTNRLFDDMKNVQTTLVRLVSALRKELHLAAYENQFLLQLEDMEKRGRAMFNRSAGLSD